MKTLHPFSINELKNTAADFLQLTQGYKKFAFYGSMGSGKTTLIKAICKELGSTDTVTSPTFSIINEYFSTQNSPIYHLDLYRIDSITELLDIGFEDYLYEDRYIFIEWPEKAESLIPDFFIKVFIEFQNTDNRLVKIDI